MAGQAVDQAVDQAGAGPARPRAFEVRQQVDAWERHNGETLLGLRCAVRDRSAFTAREVNLQLDDVHLAHVRATPHRVVRDGALIADRPVDAVVVYAALRGEAVLELAGVRRVMRPGQLVVCDADRPFARGFAHGVEELAVRVPVAALEARTGGLRLGTPVVVDARGPGDDPVARALVRAVGRAVDAPVPVPADEEALLDLVAVLASAGRAASPVAHRAAARAWIDDHLADPTLSATAVAAGAGVSERTLSRLFAESGTSVPRYVLARRLARAHALLRHPDLAGVRVADIAARCGFTSVPHFSQAFRTRYGATPGQVRHEPEATERPA
ncbi:MAG: helix-turn-helix domain-containing protein [Nocardioides alkalitolerans]